MAAPPLGGPSSPSGIAVFQIRLHVESNSEAGICPSPLVRCQSCVRHLSLSWLRSPSVVVSLRGPAPPLGGPVFVFASCRSCPVRCRWLRSPFPSWVPAFSVRGPSVVSAPLGCRASVGSLRSAPGVAVLCGSALPDCRSSPPRSPSSFSSLPALSVPVAALAAPPWGSSSPSGAFRLSLPSWVLRLRLVVPFEIPTSPVAALAAPPWWARRLRPGPSCCFHPSGVPHFWSDVK